MKRHAICVVALCLLHVYVSLAMENSTWDYAELMIQRFQNATKRLGDKIRAEEKLPEQMTTTEWMVALTSYVSQQMKRPPLQSVETNLIIMHKNHRRMTRTIKRLHRILYEIASDCGSSAMESKRCIDPAFAGDPSHDSCEEMLQTKLVRVQGEKFSLIKSTSD